MNQQQPITTLFPLLVPVNEQFTVYNGYITTSNNQSYQCSIHFDQNGAMIHCSPDLMQLLSLKQQQQQNSILSLTSSSNKTGHHTSDNDGGDDANEDSNSATFYDLLQQRLTQIMTMTMLNQNTAQQQFSSDMKQRFHIQQIFMNELRDVLDRIHQVIDYRNKSNNNQSTNNTGSLLTTTTVGNSDRFATSMSNSSSTLTPSNVQNLSMTGVYRQMISNIDEIGWNRVVDMDTDMNNVTFVIRDKSEREHEIYIRINHRHRASNESIRLSHHANLPLSLTQKIQVPSQSNNPFKSILDQYEKTIDKIQDFLAVMQNLDDRAWILEPEHCTPAHTMRRIAIGSHSSIQIEVNPITPRSIPDIRFLGADSIIAPMKESLMKCGNEWNNNLDLAVNLETVLNIKLPKKEEEQASEFSGECGVCYSYRNDDKIPDKVCDNIRCCMPFHSSCLVQWLRALHDVHQVFDTLTGLCPYCQEPIHVKDVAK